MTTPFRFFKLPVLLQEDVISCMEIYEIRDLSRLSKKCNFTVQRAVGRFNPYYVHVVFRDQIIELFRVKKDMEGTREEVPGSSVKIDEIVATNYERLDYIAALFKTPTIYLFYNFQPSTVIFNSLEFIKTLNVFIGSVDANVDDEIVDEFPGKILSLCRDIPELYFECLTSEGFRLATDVEPFRFKILHIGEAKWVSGENINKLFMDCEELRLEKSGLGQAAIKEFLQRWVKGSNLIFAGFEDVPPFTENIFEGLPGTCVRKLTSTTPEVKHHVFGENECFLIQQENEGMTAAGYRSPDTGNFILTTSYEL